MILLFDYDVMAEVEAGELDRIFREWLETDGTSVMGLQGVRNVLIFSQDAE